VKTVRTALGTRVTMTHHPGPRGGPARDGTATMSAERRTTGTVPGREDIPVAELYGEVDAANAAGFEAALAGPAEPAVVVDLSQAGYLDSAGFAVVDRLLATTALAVVVTPGSVLRTAAQLMGIPINDTVDQAGATLRSPRQGCAKYDG
jgi:anti-sigma B factor antagonist